MGCAMTLQCARFSGSSAFRFDRRRSLARTANFGQAGLYCLTKPTPLNYAQAMPRAVKCPTCRKEGHWFDGPYGPFCSKRCKLVDLGKWLNEENKIAEPLRPDHFQEFEKSVPG